MSGEREIETPPDPAGTQPKVEPSSLLPARREPSLFADAPEPPPEPAPEPGDADAGAPIALVDDERAEAPHAARFQFLLGALIAFGIAAIVATVAVFGARAGGDDGPAWSPWRPTADGTKGAEQIAEHVAPQYRLANGDQMVHITAGELEVQDFPLDLVMRQQGKIAEIDGDSVLYRMCGLGDACTIKGKPSQSRALLMLREATELALYSLHYLRGIDQVVIFVPPSFAKVGDKEKRQVRIENQALLFRRADLETALDAPLRATLGAPTPTVRTVAKARATTWVAQVTSALQFSFSLVQQNNDDGAFLVLEKLTLAEQIRRQEEAAQKQQEAIAGLGGGGAPGGGAPGGAGGG